ncbi:MAG: energy transducer TonB, partial [Hyphomicrobium sp.]
LTPPPSSFSGSAGGAGRSAGFERPPGITRSGANDDFARGVIRALQQTMPQLREVLGRVTVRILLTENGNVSDVQVVKSANIAALDQSVVFAVKQTSYPFPPPNSNVADRTFLVTYVYH